MLQKWMHFVNDETQTSNDATWKKLLPSRGALHALLVKIKCTNGATAGRSVNILDVVDNIEIKGDGSTVLFSMYPKDVEKWMETLQGRELTAVQDEAAGAVQEMVFPIWFGRDLYDPEYYLPLARFGDVNLEITYSPNIAADGGFATGTVSIDVMLLITPEDGQLSNAGTLCTRRIKSYTTVASGEEEIALPSRTIIRMIGNYVYEANIADGTDVSKVVLKDYASGNELFTADWDDLLNLNREMFPGSITHAWRLLAQNDDVLDTRLGLILGFAIMVHLAVDTSDDSFQTVRVDAHTGDRIVLDINDVDVTAGSEVIGAHAADIDIFFEARGKAPGFFGFIPFTYHDNPAGWLNTEKYSSLQVVHSQGGAGAAAYVSIQEFRKF